MLSLLVVVGVLTWVVDWLGGAIAAKISGASTETAIIAGLAGLVLFLFTGPIGILLGVAGTVFILEFYRQQDARASVKAAAITTAGMLGSAVMQALLTGSMLLAMAGVALF